MREIRSSGSVRGVWRNPYPYRDCLSLFPFVSDWIGIKGLSLFTTALYTAVSIFPGLGYMVLWIQV